MANLRRIVLVGLAISLLWGQWPTRVEANRPTAAGIPASYELFAENETFQLYADRATLAFKVVDKRSGYIWHSNLDETTKDDKLNKTWTAFARSGLSLDYLDEKAIDKRASITNAEHTLEVNAIEGGFEAFLKFVEPSIGLTVRVVLEPEGVRVEVPAASIIQEDANFKLGVLYVYPFFGATKEASVPGYMFIPDGPGSLVAFSAATKAKNMFYGRYYGEDLGMLTFLPYDPWVNPAHDLSIPVIGMAHDPGQNAYLAIVEKGAAYGEVHAHPAGIITKFNFIYNAFIYNESYFQATNRSGAGVTTLQRRTNEFDVLIHYRFLTGAASDYVGMARSYQQYLVDKGALPKVADADSHIGIRLEFLGSEKERVLLWERPIVMTTVRQMADILAALAIENPDVVYYGWQPLGATSMPPPSLKVERQLGSVAELTRLAETIAAEGGNFYLYLDPQAALLGQSGYSPRTELAMSITNFNLEGYQRGKVNFYFNLESLQRRYAALRQSVFEKPAVGLALDGIGSVLYSDFKSNHLLNRENAIAEYQALLAENDGRTALYAPNDYLFGAMRAYYDMPLTDSGYIYATGVVPFLPIVLAGYVPYYGPALNFSSNARADLLRLVDFGVYPSYFLSQEVTAKILTTNSSWIYTSSYAQWAQDIEQTYQWLDSLLAPVKGQRVVARQVLAEGVVATTYENGKQLIVNYTDAPFTGAGVMVNSQDALLQEAMP